MNGGVEGAKDRALGKALDKIFWQRSMVTSGKSRDEAAKIILRLCSMPRKPSNQAPSKVALAQ